MSSRKEGSLQNEKVTAQGQERPIDKGPKDQHGGCLFQWKFLHLFLLNMNMKSGSLFKISWSCLQICEKREKIFETFFCHSELKHILGEKSLAVNRYRIGEGLMLIREP